MGVEMPPKEWEQQPNDVMPREGHGSRNREPVKAYVYPDMSCPARGMGVEIYPLSVVFVWPKMSCPARGRGVEI